MSKNITLMGASYSDVPAVQLPQTGGGTAIFYDDTGALNISANGTHDVTGYASAVVNVPGGSEDGSVWQDENGYVVLDDEPGTNVSVVSFTVSASGTHTAPEGTAYSPVTVPSGTAGTPTATKGAVSNHAVTVTPSVTNTTGFITGSTKTGTGVSVSASELVSGTKSITANGSAIDVTNYASVDVAVSGGSSIDIPIFDEDWEIDWSGITTITCNKTFAECLDLWNNAVGGAYVHSHLDDPQYPMVSDYTATAVYGDNTKVVYVAHSGATPMTDYTYYSDGTIESTSPSAYDLSLTATQNGTYYPGDGVYTSVTVNVSGGESASKKQINFIDYDGTILHSYSKDEWQSVSTLPSNPSHDGLTSQGWNWTKAQIDAQLTAMPDGEVWIGQMYITTSGDTEIDVVMQEGRLSPILNICVNGTVTVDWGDNTTASTVTGTSLTTMQAPTHTYASAGDYTITIHVVSGSFRFYGTSAYLLLRKNTTLNQNRVYANCVQAVRFGNGVTSIGDYAFYYCCSLASITIPSTVTSIGSSAFYYCTSLTSVTIPNGVTSIGNYAFYYCTSLASVTIPNGVTSIGESAFYYCTVLAGITIPSGVTSIEGSAFYQCYSLASVTIPSGVTSIGGSAFYYCCSLTSVTIPNGVTSIGNSAFYYCISLASITIPSTVTSIGNNAFYQCISLASITLPSGVTSIGSNVFNQCTSLASITIPSTVTSIGGSAFIYCYGVAEYHILSTTVPTGGTNMFGNIVSDCIIYVPSASLEDYKTTTNWSTYASFMVGE